MASIAKIALTGDRDVGKKGCKCTAELVGLRKPPTPITSTAPTNRPVITTWAFPTSLTPL